MGLATYKSLSHVRAALTGKPVTVYWKGNQYRDYVFVEDIARAHVQVLGLPGVHIFNIGSSSGVLMTDVLHLIENITGKTLDVIDGGERAGDPMRLVADTSRIEREIGWQCRVNLKEGLQQAVQFYEQTRSLWDRHELVTDL
jgi:nucleoside-diphosphate-sugar epimerase